MAVSLTPATNISVVGSKFTWKDASAPDSTSAATAVKDFLLTFSLQTFNSWGVAETKWTTVATADNLTAVTAAKPTAVDTVTNAARMATSAAATMTGAEPATEPAAAVTQWT